MKIDEPYDPNNKGFEPLDGLKFEVATLEHVQELVKMMRERNPDIAYENMDKKIRNEINLNETDPFYWLYVVLRKKEVVALCRFFHTHGLSKERRQYDAPDGWYAMGTLVSKEYRRRGVARFAFGERIKVLKQLGGDRLYSIVDKTNLASMSMHKAFGFVEIARSEGFLHLLFEESEAVLFEVQF